MGFDKFYGSLDCNVAGISAYHMILDVCMNVMCDAMTICKINPPKKPHWVNT